MRPLVIQAGAAAQLIATVLAMRVGLGRAAADRPFQGSCLLGLGFRRRHCAIDPTRGAVIRARVGVQAVHFGLCGARDTSDDGALLRRELQAALERHVMHFCFHDALRAAIPCTQQVGPRGTCEM